MELKSYFSPKTKKASSSISGRGLYACDLIKKEEIVALRVGPIVQLQDTAEIESVSGDYNFQISDDLFLSARSQEEVEEFGLMINHSCEPNVGVYGQICIVAMRDIHAGEELTIDYAMIEARPSYSFICACSAAKCRLKISGDDWMIPDIQLRYNGFFSHHIQNKINSSKKND